MNELINSYQQFIKDRLSTPFFGNFIFVWFVFNWEIVYTTIFLSEDSIKPLNKIEFIKQNYIHEDTLILPLISAIFLTFLFPILNTIILLWREKIKRIKNDRTIKIHELATITSSEYWNLNKKMKELELKYKDAINDYNETKKELFKTSQRKNELEEYLNSLRTSNDNLIREHSQLYQKHSLDSTFKDKIYQLKDASTDELLIKSFRIDSNILYSENMRVADIDMIQVNRNSISFRAVLNNSEFTLLSNTDIYDLSVIPDSNNFSGYIIRNYTNKFVKFPIILEYLINLPIKS